MPGPPPRRGITLEDASIVTAAVAIVLASLRIRAPDSPLDILHALIVFLAWTLGSGGLAAIAARRRGYRGGAGFWLGFILGPLGVLAATFLSEAALPPSPDDPTEW